MTKNITVPMLVDSLTQINQVYIENVSFEKDEYVTMVVHCMLGLFLNAHGGRSEDFHIYEPHQQSNGYTGYIKWGDKVIFFAPTSVSVQDEEDTFFDDEPLSPVGKL